MKKAISAVVVLTLFGCSQPVTETETLLVCEGDATSIIAGFGGKDRQTFTITKVGDKVTKVKSEHQMYTLDKVDVSTKENKGPIYIQLIVESDKLVLRGEITEDRNNRDTILFNTGKYKDDRGLFGWVEGQCSVGKKAF
ncbi:MAG: hypothetical protein Q8O37_13150 [Sulfuricellaceae bacterium]|nr:hypothetical protein [Sulfuricellaceae bacterium]